MKDAIAIAAGVACIAVAIVATICWAVFYFTQCAFVPLAEMPGICLLANNR